MTKPIPYAWLLILSIFLMRAPHPAASGSIDPDVYWHLLYGDYVLDNWKIPTVDMWSWTMQGTPYQLTQWLGEVLIAAAGRLGGEYGKQSLAAFLVTSAIAMSYRAARCYLQNRTAAVLVAMVGCSVLVSMTCRPHLFSFVGLAALSWIFAAHLTTRSVTPLYFVPPVMALWANLHGGYAFGLAYAWLVLGTAAISALASSDAHAERRNLASIAVAVIVGTLATGINPYGFGIWSNTIAVGALKSVSAGLTEEWIPTNIRTNMGFAYLTVVLATTMTLGFADRRPRTYDALMLIALTVMGWWATRLSVMVSILFVPLIAKFFAATPLYTLAFANDKSDGRASLVGAVATLALVGALGAVAGATDRTIERRVQRDFPVEEVAYLKSIAFQGRLMNPMEAGGYLIQHLQQPVFLDTRLDLYGDDYYFAFMNAAAGGDNWREFMAKHNPDMVMLEHGMPLKNLIVQAGTYTIVFTGPRYTLLQRVR